MKKKDPSYFILGVCMVSISFGVGGIKEAHHQKEKINLESPHCGLEL
jgi:hypothetical protein